jgi:ABC-type amino acid transport substrate-binding protein
VAYISRSMVWCMMLASLVFTHSAQGADKTLERLRKAGKVLIAMDATYPPMEFEGKDGKVTGFDVEFATELAKRLGLKAEFVVMGWDGILAGLTSNRYDMIVSAMNITPERQRQVDFVEYAKMSQLFISTKGHKVTNDKELAGKVVATQADTTSSQYIEKIKASGVAIKAVKSFKMAPECFAAVRAGQAEVIVVDEAVGRFFVKQDPGTFMVTGRAMAPEPIGIAVKKGDAEFVKELSQRVDDMKKDGTLKRLSDAWFGGELGS